MFNPLPYFLSSALRLAKAFEFLSVLKAFHSFRI